MKFIPAPAYRNWFLLGLLVQLIAAWCSVGFHHPDEHAQVLEFCSYKLGNTPAAALPWEFGAQCRPALQPFIAWGLCRVLQTIGLFNPFTVAFLLRLMMGVFTWVVTCRLVHLLLPQMNTEKGQRAFIWCSLFVWFVPYIGVRFSAENIAGLCFFLALYYILTLQGHAAGRQVLRLVLAGLLMGVSLFVRLQMGFAFVALGAWLLFVQQWPLRHWLVLIMAGVTAMLAMICIDHWFYGAWVFTPYNYFSVNIIQHIAAKYGVEPWWWYITEFLEKGAAPVSWVLFPLFLLGIWKRPKHVFTWVAVAFIAGHCLIGHKEIRFLYPVAPAFLFLACVGFDTLMQQPARKIYRIVIPILVTANCALLIAKTCTPAHFSIKYYEAVYNYAGNNKIILATSGKTIDGMLGFRIDFYKPRGLEEQVADSPAALKAVMENAGSRPVLFLSDQPTLPAILSGYKTEKVYCILPGWMSYFNFGDWQSRSYIWSIYRVYPA